MPIQSGSLGNGGTFVVLETNDNVQLSDGNDIAIGYGDAIVISANAGNDSIFLSGTNLEVYGGDGDDTLSVSGLSENTEYSTSFGSFIDGGRGNDTISVININGYVSGNKGNDKIFGGTGSDYLFGNEGNDLISGGPGNDRIFGGTGNDTLLGGIGDDTLTGGGGKNTLVGGYGLDNFELASNGYAKVLDFDYTTDDLLFDSNTFNIYVPPTGTTVPDWFVLGSSFSSPDQRFLYDLSKGNLFYDGDGLGSSASTKLIANFGAGTVVNPDDFKFYYS